MRVLNSQEISQVSGGGFVKMREEQRALPGTDVTNPKSTPGNRTGWCRGYGNVKGGMVPKHDGTGFPCPSLEA